MADGAFTYSRAVALDYDGTLADGPIAPDTRAALAETRAKGIGVIVVTGRIMSELRTVFAEIEDHVDAIVAEQGAVLVTPSGSGGWSPRSTRPSAPGSVSWAWFIAVGGC